MKSREMCKCATENALNFSIYVFSPHPLIFCSPPPAHQPSTTSRVFVFAVVCVPDKRLFASSFCSGRIFSVNRRE